MRVGTAPERISFGVVGREEKEANHRDLGVEKDLDVSKLGLMSECGGLTSSVSSI